MNVRDPGRKERQRAVVERDCRTAKSNIDAPTTSYKRQGRVVKRARTSRPPARSPSCFAALNFRRFSISFFLYYSNVMLTDSMCDDGCAILRLEYRCYTRSYMVTVFSDDRCSSWRCMFFYARAGLSKPLKPTDD